MDECLYIPHGSDESWKNLNCMLRNETHFISHMVQMKGLFLQPEISRLSALYPTWFRWKGRPYIFSPCRRGYFISHMVQMKAVLGSTPPSVRSALYPTWFRWKLTPQHCLSIVMPSLYPTWFRWKYQTKLDQILCHKLYIPHGSDESEIYLPSTAIHRTPFISHMVQMKVRRQGNCSSYQRSFISHMVQMKGVFDWLCKII